MPIRRQINPQLLLAARKKAGDGTKSAAAAAAGMTWQGYNQWEKGPGRTSFDWNSFQALCDYLGVKPEDITSEVPETQQAV
ncbi:helix-turn-helix transcriptional regulator [Deinococcus sp. 12RED42]|uniref:helix-turn-helix domain-containing protein n=1 Tax=Deinococcus sp. 12RED42 TaxID=2745872 RepID=UPI001E3F9345|nr:helix-turn-helix transcriptional regulator [Deinococcus sp. 12RED42]MCD0166449.1 helix-turn-helix transcriptional regulator [Deinococcus sp. 12RED42]